MRNYFRAHTSAASLRHGVGHFAVGKTKWSKYDYHSHFLCLHGELCYVTWENRGGNLPPIY